MTTTYLFNAVANFIGCGHARHGVLKAVKETTMGMANGRRIRFVLFDKQPGHVHKVMMFRRAAGGEEFMVHWTHYSSCRVT
ncbi:hypothetical protein NNL21_32180 [Paenibacillus mendelii]|nr:hypothetical protein [Paenibacillus mendelii]